MTGDGLFTQRYFVPIAVLLLVVLAVVQLTSIRQEAQTWDEGIHLAAGLSYWKLGDYRMSPEHPPVAKLLCALPLLFLPLELPLQYPSWNQKDEVEFGAQLLYASRLSADEILFPARCVTIGLTLLLAMAVALWTRRYFGPSSGLLALAFVAFDPNIIAHGRYVTTDLAVTLFAFLACAFWGEALARRTPGMIVLSGISLGLALGSKFSAMFLLPVFLILALFRWPGFRILLAVLALAYLTLVFLYLPELIRERMLFPHSYVGGFENLFDFVRGGHPAYLLGEISTRGWWYYFPVAYLVKAPTALVLLVLTAIISMVRERPRPTWPAAVIFVPCVVFWSACIGSHMNIGIRHLLPAYLLTIPLAVAGAVRYLPNWATLSLLCLLAAESLSIYPHYLAFFNRPSGGPVNGPRYLVDSNIDWGQDTKKLKAWLDERGIHQVCRAYFGQAILAHYGIQELPLPNLDDPATDCVAAISVTLLHGLYLESDPYRWLREKKPVARIGYSIYVYDLRKSR